MPYVWDSDGVPHLVDLSDFPRAEQWLKGHRARLEQRHCVRAWGKAWWDLHDPVKEPLQHTTKVLVPDVARSNRFATDSEAVPQHSAYYIIPADGDAGTLTGILNSSAIELLVRRSAPRVKDGFSRYRRQFLANLPIPQVNADLRTELIHLIETEDHSALNVFVSQELFQVDHAEILAELSRLTSRRPPA